MALSAAKEGQEPQGRVDTALELCEAAAVPMLFRLYVRGIPQSWGSQELARHFSEFGTVKDVHLLANRLSNISWGLPGTPQQSGSTGLAFISYANKTEAELAISQSLQSNVALPGAHCPLEVRYAHSRWQPAAGPSDNRSLFFSNAPPDQDELSMLAFWKAYGEVQAINLFTDKQNGQSKCCGTVTFSSRELATGAMQEIGQWQTPPPFHELQVQWADPELAARKRAGQGPRAPENVPGNMVGRLHGDSLSLPAVLGVPAHMGLPQNMAFHSAGNLHGSAEYMMQGVSLPQGLPSYGARVAPINAALEPPPPGCDPDSFKLFVGNLPPTCGREQLLPFFTAIGKVVELVLLRPSQGSDSRAGALVWMSMRKEAEQAIANLNLRHVAFEGEGGNGGGVSNGPLVVRRAKPSNARRGPNSSPMPILRGSPVLPDLMHPHALGAPSLTQPQYFQQSPQLMSHRLADSNNPSSVHSSWSQVPAPWIPSASQLSLHSGGASVEHLLALPPAPIPVLRYNNPGMNSNYSPGQLGQLGQLTPIGSLAPSYNVHPPFTLVAVANNAPQPGNYPVTAQQLPGNYPVATQQPGTYPITAHQLPGSYPGTAQQLSGNYAVASQQLAIDQPTLTSDASLGSGYMPLSNGNGQQHWGSGLAANAGHGTHDTSSGNQRMGGLMGSASASEPLALAIPLEDLRTMGLDLNSLSTRIQQETGAQACLAQDSETGGLQLLLVGCQYQVAHANALLSLMSV